MKLCVHGTWADVAGLHVARGDVHGAVPDASGWRARSEIGEGKGWNLQKSSSFLLLIADIVTINMALVTTSKALATRSDALVPR